MCLFMFMCDQTLKHRRKWRQRRIFIFLLLLLLQHSLEAMLVPLYQLYFRMLKCVKSVWLCVCVCMCMCPVDLKLSFFYYNCLTGQLKPGSLMALLQSSIFSIHPISFIQSIHLSLSLFLFGFFSYIRFLIFFKVKKQITSLSLSLTCFNRSLTLFWCFNSTWQHRHRHHFVHTHTSDNHH